MTRKISSKDLNTGQIKIAGLEKSFALEVESTASSRFRTADSREIGINIGTHETKITIQRGFKTDLASIPRAFWLIFPPIGTKHNQYGTPAVLHDYLYASKIFNRKTADLIFLTAMKQYKVRLVVRYAFFFVVRVFGGKHYAS